MKLYFNDSQNAIDISSFNHIIQLGETREDSYTFVLYDFSNINSIADAYEGVVINTITIKDNDNVETKMQRTSLNLKLSVLVDRIDDMGVAVTLTLSNI